MSPSVWREWIEILCRMALVSCLMSPSVWREWIEMSEYMESVGEPVVSLRVEGVD